MRRVTESRSCEGVEGGWREAKAAKLESTAEEKEPKQFRQLAHVSRNSANLGTYRNSPATDNTLAVKKQCTRRIEDEHDQERVASYWRPKRAHIPKGAEKLAPYTLA
eukprot:2501989-Pleurochrysis_carterae.AAC.1